MDTKETNYKPRRKKCSLWMILPIIVSLLATIGLWVVYIIAVKGKKICSLDVADLQEHCDLRHPFISVIGDHPPESCVFSQVLNMLASLAFVIAILRFSQLKSKVRRPWLNIFALMAHCLSSFGLTLVANFQLSNNEKVHNTGLVFTFAFGTVACWIQVPLTFQTNVNNEGRKVGVVRVLLSITVTVCLSLYFFMVAQHYFIHGARAQWAMATCFLLFIGTFAIELRHAKFVIHCIDSQQNAANLSESASTIIKEFHSDHF
ncbi:transmembrane protein 150C [Heterodontus francisci]|uniref:transmembrane protein 150C n=1 Tax=Heterodontus francisci TaxID=7792 RepID=UPI00355B796B